MIDCRESSASIPLYIDNELSEREMLALEAHLSDCPECRGQFDSLRAVVDNVRAAAPLYEPPEGSIDRVRGILDADARRMGRRRLMAVAAGAMALCLGSLYLFSRHASHEFSDFAAAAHMRYVSGSVPLDLASEEPERVSGWFSHRLPFRFQVPNYVNDPASPKRYALEGARLMDYSNSEVAYLAYRMNARPISLLVSASDRIAPQGGQTFRTGGIDFHFSSQRGLRLITWRDRGLNYALVSDLDVTGAESCVICHGSAADRRKIDRLPH